MYTLEKLMAGELILAGSLDKGILKIYWDAGDGLLTEAYSVDVGSANATIKEIKLFAEKTYQTVTMTGGLIRLDTADYTKLFRDIPMTIANNDPDILTITGLNDTYDYGDTVSFTVTSSDPDYAPVVNVNGVVLIPTDTNDGVYTYSFSMGYIADIKIDTAEVNP